MTVYDPYGFGVLKYNDAMGVLLSERAHKKTLGATDTSENVLSAGEKKT